MWLHRLLLSGGLIVAALMLQVSVLARLGLPGAAPDLLLLVVIGLALAYGPAGGCLAGFSAGRSRSMATPLLVVGAAAFSTTLAYAAVGALVGDTAARHVGLPGLLVTAVLYDVILAPFVVPGVIALARRTVRDDLGNGGTGFGPRRPRRGALDRRGSLFGGGGSRTGGAVGLGTVPGFGDAKRSARNRPARG